MKFKHEKFRKDIILKRSLENRIGMREAGLYIGISAATLSRLERGKLPDLLTFIKTCEWLDKPVNTYIK